MWGCDMNRQRTNHRLGVHAVVLALVTCGAGVGPAAGQGIDINQGGDAAEGLAPGHLRVIQNRLVFAADDGLEGREPWVSNGSTFTAQLVDVMPGLDGSSPREFVDLDGTMLFAATGSVGGCEIWRSDLTPGDAHLVADSTPDGICPSFLTVVGRYVYYSHDHPDFGYEVMRTDGTALGTERFDINPGPAGSYPSGFTAVGDVVYFAADNGSDGIELHRILADGTHEQVIDLFPGPDSSRPSDLVHVGGSTVVFRANDGASGNELWRTDGVTTTLVADINPGSASSTPAEMFLLSPGVIVFRASGSGTGTELWRSNGATASLVKDIVPGTLGSRPEHFAAWNGLLWFAADDGSATGEDLWMSDGTGPGTSLVADITPDGDSSISGLYPLSSRLLIFNEPFGGDPDELWTTDGTEAGTQLVATFDSIDRYAAVVKDGLLYFVADDGVSGRELWSSDGTPGNTAPVWDHVEPGSRPSNLVWTGSELHFVASDGVNGRELWASDGTVPGTAMIVDLEPTGSAFPYDTDLVPFAGHTYFGFFDPVLGRELFRTDGTPGGTGIVVDLEPGSDWSDPVSLFAGSTHMIWNAYNPPDSAYEVMATDGVTVTRLDSNPDGDDEPSEARGALGDRILFSARGPGIGEELFVTDGTPAGTELIADIEPGGSSSPEHFGHGLGLAFFRATTVAEGGEPWVTDGEAGGTTMLGDLIPGPDDSDPSGFVEAGDQVFFVADHPVAGTSLWVTDGTPLGTEQIFDLDSGGPESPGGMLVPLGDRVMFYAHDPAFGDEPMVSDGTVAGTFRLRDINPGPASSNPDDDEEELAPVRVGNRVYFIADDGIHGYELWVTDGTPDGTQLARDVNPGPSGSNLGNLTAGGPWTLFFTANDSVIGEELFRYSPPAGDVTDDGAFDAADLAVTIRVITDAGFIPPGNPDCTGSGDPIDGADLTCLLDTIY